LVLLFVLWNGLSLIWSADPIRTQFQVERWIQLLVLVFLLWDLYTTRSAVLAGLQAFILGEYVALGFALGNFISGSAFYSTYQRFSPAEQSNPDGFGFIMALGIPVAWYLANSTTTGRWNTARQVLNYAFVPAGMFGVVLSGTRTALIASLVGMAYGIASLTRVRLAVRIPAIICMTAVALFMLPQVRSMRSFERLGTTYTELTEGTLNNRLTLWKEGFDAFPHSPLKGIGANMYPTVTTKGQLAHNSFISVLVELGLIGFALFGFILAIAGAKALRQPRWESRFWLTMLAVWGIGASSLTYEYRKPTWLILSLLVASAAVIRRPERPVQVSRSAGSAPPPPSPARRY